MMVPLFKITDMMEEAILWNYNDLNKSSEKEARGGEVGAMDARGLPDDMGSLRISEEMPKVPGGEEEGREPRQLESQPQRHALLQIKLHPSLGLGQPGQGRNSQEASQGLAAT